MGETKESTETIMAGEVEVSEDPTEEECAAEPMLQLFRHSHLRAGELRDASREFCRLARRVAHLPRNPERTASLRKLREAKDCAVTAILWRQPAIPGA